MPGVTQEQIAAARRMSAIEFLQKYRPNSLVKSSARGEYQLAEHDSFKINAKSSLWHWKSRDIGGKSALNYLIYVEGVPFVEAVRLLCEESPGYVPTPHEQVERKRPPFRLPPIAENCDRITRYLLGRGISNAVSYTVILLAVAVINKSLFDTDVPEEARLAVPSLCLPPFPEAPLAA